MKECPVTVFEQLKAELSKRGSLELPVVTGSMSPVIPVGARITIVPLSRPPRRFDIIVFLQQSILICHYVWHLNRFAGDKTLVTRSLAGGEDLPVPADQVLGLVPSHSIPRRARLLLVVKALSRRYLR